MFESLKKSVNNDEKQKKYIIMDDEEPIVWITWYNENLE